MSKQRHTAEQIISKLREAEVELAKGLKVPQICKKLEVAEQTYYRWRKEYGGLRTDQAKRLKDLERENARLKKLLAEAELDKAILREAATHPNMIRAVCFNIPGRGALGCCRSSIALIR